jgi:hypothetical protein
LDLAAEKAALMIQLEDARGGGVPLAHRTAWLFMRLALAYQQEYGATDTVRVGGAERVGPARGPPAPDLIVFLAGE